MILNKVEINDDFAKEISSWKYEGKYSIYNLPDWDDMINQNYSLTDSEKRKSFIGYINEKEQLIGFTRLIDKEDSVHFAIGIHPNYLENNIGKELTKLAITESHLKYSNKPIILDVRTWNQRAINCYKSQGFEIIDTVNRKTHLGLGEFFIMKYI